MVLTGKLNLKKIDPNALNSYRPFLEIDPTLHNQFGPVKQIYSTQPQPGSRYKNTTTKNPNKPK